MRIKLLNKSDNPTPRFATADAAGFDLAGSEEITIEPASAQLIPTGIYVKIPDGYEGQLRLRSSMWDQHMVIPNAPGTIDSDYIGEIKIPIRNLEIHSKIVIPKGLRIAQLIINKLPVISLEEVTQEEFSQIKTNRGTGGFGSTGKK